MLDEEERESRVVNVISRLFKKKFVLIGLIALLILIIVISSIFYRFGSKREISSRTVDFGLKNIGKLVTQAGFFTNVQVISDAREIFGVTVPFTQSKYIYSYDGVVEAGINFENVTLQTNPDSNTVIVELPEVEIITNEVFDDSLEIYDESKSIFTPLDLNKVNLSRISLKEEVLEKAVANGILDSACKNAEVLISNFLASIPELQEYTVEFKWPAEQLN